MKKSLILLVVGIMVGSGLTLFLKSGEESTSAKKEKKVLYWVAPMDPNYRRDEPGKSPMGMDLVPVYEEDTAKPKEKKILYWVAPMDPNFRRDKPGKSPMGMDLVPVYDDEGDTGTGIKIDSTVVNNLGVRTAPAIKGPLSRAINSVGYVEYDETKISHVHLRTKGWVEKLKIKAVGERVKKGDTLFELYSPDLVNAQEEYLQALATNGGLLRASKERLRSLGLTLEQIKALKSTKKVKELIQIHSPQDGVISELNIREGMHVMPATVIMSIVDLSEVWLIADVFEQQASWVKLGLEANASLSYLPGKTFKGQVDFIYPNLEPKTRSLRVRLKFKNPGEILKPNMFAHVSISGTPKQDVVSIPKEALIRSGQTERVIIAKGEGRFAAKEVTSGIESKDFVEIISGLAEGAQVVTSAQFMIDSESSLKASFNQMERAKDEHQNHHH